MAQLLEALSAGERYLWADGKPFREFVCDEPGVVRDCYISLMDRGKRCGCSESIQ